ncbi:hypothetical protein PMAYCL1PPCAC_17457, partial [Pristionchus mayeri]
MPFPSLGMRDEDVIHFLLLTLLDGTAMTINFILITAVIRSTPPVMKRYSALILFTAIVDCNAAFMSWLATVIVENLEGSIIFIYLGPCRFIHVRVCHAAQAIHVQSIGESCILLLVSFSYRLLSFRLASINNGPRRDSRSFLFVICLLATIPAVITTMTFSNSPTPPPQSLLDHPDLSDRLFSVFNMTASNIISTENVLPRVSIGYIICLYSTASPALFVLRRRLLRKIHAMGAAADKHRHHEIFRSLTLQMFMPLSFSVAFVFWIIDFLGFFRLEVFQRAIMPISTTFTIISPMIVLYYLPPYRKY